MKKGLKQAAALAAACLLCMSTADAAQVPESISAKSAILVDARSGRVLYEKNADEKSLIASTTKIMTGLLVCEAGELEREISVPAEAVGVEGSSLYLRPAERITVRDLLYGMMLRSGNDAAVALAIVTSGSTAAFVEAMNEKAAGLGMDSTHFENPNGLDGESHYSTARDLAKLAAAAMENETFRAIVSSKQFSTGTRGFTNHNKLLWRVEGADGVKTGYTKRAGRILVGSAVRNNQRLICVTICDPDDWRDQKVLLDYGFSEFAQKTLVKSGQTIGYAAVVGSQTERVPLLAGMDFVYPLTDEETADTALYAPGFVYAPVLPGQAGWLEVRLSGVGVGRVPVYYGQTAEEKITKRSFWERIFGG